MDGSELLFMVIEHFKDRDAVAIYRRVGVFPRVLGMLAAGLRPTLIVASS
jgi:hypothetical protein